MITKTQLIEDLKRIWPMAAGELNVKLYRAIGKYNYKTYYEVWGDWGKALKAARIPLTGKQRARIGSHGTCGTGETLLKRKKLLSYRCFKCEQPMRGLGRRAGHWHCDRCREWLERMSVGMGW